MVCWLILAILLPIGFIAIIFFLTISNLQLGCTQKMALRMLWLCRFMISERKYIYIYIFKDYVQDTFYTLIAYSIWFIKYYLKAIWPFQHSSFSGSTG